jgi:hypothetical protein
MLSLEVLYGFELFITELVILNLMKEEGLAAEQLRF